MKYFLSTLLLGWLCSLSFQVWGQQALRFDRLTVEDGLSSNRTTKVLQDHKGFLWIGTRDGLNRFDGYNFRVFRPSAKGLSDHDIRDIVEDRHGFLWVATYRGLNRFDPRTERFEQFHHDPDDPNSLADDKVTSLMLDQNGMLWVGTRGGGISLLDPQSGRFSNIGYHEAELQGLSGGDVRDLLQDRQGNIWIATADRGLDRYDPHSGSFTNFRYDANDPHSLCQDSVSRLVEGNDGDIWIGTYDSGLCRYRLASGMFTRYPRTEGSLNNSYILALHVDSEGQLSGGSYGGGLFYWNRQRQKFDIYLHSTEDAQSLSGDYVRDIYQDRQGVIWVATDSGLSRHLPTSRQFHHYRQVASQPGSLGNNDVRAITQDNDGRLWVATYGGVYASLDDNAEFTSMFAQAELGTERVTSLLEDSNGTLWVGTFGKGLVHFDFVQGKKQSFRYRQDDPNALSHTIVTTLFQDRSGRVWVGTLGGISLYEPGKPGFSRIRHHSGKRNSLGNNYVSAIYQDRRGAMWIGFRNSGLDRFDPVKGQFAHYRYEDNNPFGLSNDRVTAIYQDRRGILWIGTGGGGLNRYDSNDDSFTRIDREHGLSGNMVEGILEDDLGDLWISTNRGLSKYQVKTGRFTNYDSKDGLQGNEFNQGAAYKNARGELFFGGTNGFNRFSADQLQGTVDAPQPVFTDFRVFNRSLPVLPNGNGISALPMAIHALDKLTLTPEQALFSLEFSALSLAAPERSRYAYRLEGYDKHWIETDYRNRQASYTNIPPGDYVLRVKAGDRNGVWSERELSMPLTILPPWYLTLKMKVVYGLIVTLLLLWIFYRLTVIPSKRARDLRILVEQRTAEIAKQRDTIGRLLTLNTEFSQNISHSLKTPLNLVLGPVERMLERHQVSHDELLRVKRNALRLKKDVDALLAFSQSAGMTETGKQAYGIGAICRAMVDDLQGAAKHKEQTLHFRCQSDAAVWLEAEAIERILLNLLENAMKYTPRGGHINVTVAEVGGKVELTVSDNGPGIPLDSQQRIFERGTRLQQTSDQPGSGIGLAFVKEIVLRNEGAIDLQSEPGWGTRFIVRFRAIEHSVGTVESVGSNCLGLMATINQLAMDQLSPVIPQDETPGKPTLLVVEDDQDMRQFIVESFAARFRCLEACDGSDGLAQAREHLPDLIISDWMMPNTTGLALLKSLKLDNRLSHIPVILVTAAGDLEGRDKALTSGAIHYFSKPFDEKQLHCAVDEALDLQQFAARRVEEDIIAGVELDVSHYTFIEQSDLLMLGALSRLLHQQFDDPEFSNPVNVLAEQLHMEPRRLRRKLSKLIQNNPSSLLRDVRLEHSRRLLDSGMKSTEVYLRTGFSSLEYFGRCFKNKFGTSPRSYQQQSFAVGHPDKGVAGH